MRGIILTGGEASRLRQQDSSTNKHLLAVGGRAMIAWGLDLMAELGITDITIVTDRKDLTSFHRLIGNKDLPSFERVALVGQTDNRGIVPALSAVPKEKRDAPCAVLLADNLFESTLVPAREYFDFQQDKALVVLKHVDKPGDNIVVELQKNLITSIEESPETPKSDLVATGLYFFPEDIFSIIDTLPPSPRGVPGISDALRVYLERGRLGYVILDGWWIAVQTQEELDRTDRLLKETHTQTGAEQQQ